MSFAALIGFILKLSRLFLKIHRWVLLKMSLSCKISGSNGKLPTNLKLKKARDPIHGPNWFTKWKRKFLVLWLLGLFITGSIWVFSSFSDGAVRRQGITPAACEEAAPILLEHFNVTNALVSPFSESDQISASRCMKQPDSEMPSVNDLTCASKFTCSEKHEFWKLEGLDAGKVETNDQCPIQDELIHRELEQSTIPEKCLSYVFQSGISSITRLHQISRQIILQLAATGDSVKGRCWSVCFCFITMLKMCWWVLVAAIVRYKMPHFYSKFWKFGGKKLAKEESQQLVQHKHQQKQQQQSLPKAGGNWRMKVLIVFVITGIIVSVWLFIHFYWKHKLTRKETLANMCDERARMLQDQFNVSLNHVHALAILVSTFHHGKHPSAIDQKTFGEYTERTAFERPLTSGVAYAVKVVHSEREQFEQQCGWRIKKMATEDQTSLQDCIPENLDPAPIQDEYAPVIFSQETVSHIVSIDMMSGKEDRENIIRARTSGKGVLTSPFKLLKSNHLGVILTFAVYNTDLPLDATPQQRNEATVGYLGASYDVPSLVEKLLHQLASKETIVVNVYDTTNLSAPINMYGDDVTDTGLLQICPLDFGDPVRKHEMHCRFKQQPPLPWTAINSSVGVLVITLLAAQIFYAAISRIAKVESNLRKMEELKVRAEAADVAKSQFLATVSHEIRTPMNGVLGMLQMLMDTDLDANQQDYAQTAHASGRDLISLINEVLDQAKIESGRLELEAVPFDLRSVLDNVLSLFSGKSNEKGIELAVYVSNQVPEVVIGDPGRFRQIITNLVGNSIKFTHDKGHIFVTVHLADEVWGSPNVRDKVLTQGLHLIQDSSGKTYNTLSGYPVVDRWKSWEKFKKLKDTEKMEKCDMIKLLVTVEDTGVGIPSDAQSRIFTPFMQADSSTSRTYGGTGIGLSISNCLVDLMGGEIGFVSETGTGSTFSFTGALRKGEASSLDKKWQHYDPAASEFKGMRALVVDKRSIRAEVTKYHLQRLGISVNITSCLKHAASYMCNTSELADLAMVLIDKDVWDKEDAVALHQSLKERWQNGRVEVPVNLPKIFLLATSISPTECNELKASGLVNNVMTKPLRLSFIISSFQDALGKKRQANRKKPSTLGHLLRGRRILVVDDNVVNRRVAEGALKKYGAIVTCVASGKAALPLLQPPHDFDACFMDLQMPEMDGFEATRQVRSVEGKINEKIASGEVSKEMYGDVSHWHTPILAMTADVIQATNEECMKCGMDEYVSKPFEEEQLYSAVARFFETG